MTLNTASVYTRAQVGLDAPLVTVEVHISNGLPKFSIVGMPEIAVRESKERVRSAIINSRFEFPARRITINLAPADLPKEGGRFDLPIAIGILVASGQIKIETLAQHEFAGELALGGQIRSVPGALAMAVETKRAARTLVLGVDNAAEAALVQPLEIYGPSNLLDLCAHFSGEHALKPMEALPLVSRQVAGDLGDLSEVVGQAQAKQALLVCAAGGHNLLMVGPPGSGKTMLASRLPGILPPLTEAEAIAVARVLSIRGIPLNPEVFFARPFRSPHHTASAVSLVGGGSSPLPGEISLAYLGVLFLDELPEFSRHVLEVLREPLESGEIQLARAQGSAIYPARFQLVAAMNPCPCGYYGTRVRDCRCSGQQVSRYLGRLSGPLLDRIDCQVEVESTDHQLLVGGAGQSGMTSQIARAQVIAAREVQHERSGGLNARMTTADVARYCRLSSSLKRLMLSTLASHQISARGYHRIIRVARTIADLSGREHIAEPDVLAALGYRFFDRQS